MKSKENKPAIEKSFAADVYLKMYRANRELSKNNKIKVYITVDPDGTVSVNESLGDRTLLGTGMIQDTFKKPEETSEWSSVIYVYNIIPKYITKQGIVRVWMRFSWYEESENREPDMVISQYVPMDDRDNYDNTFIGHGSCRTKAVEDFSKWVIESKSNQ